MILSFCKFYLYKEYREKTLESNYKSKKVKGVISNE